MRPHSFCTATLLALSFLLCEPAFSQSMTPTYQEAARLYKQGKNAPALEKLEAVLQKNPRDPHARFLKGLILTEQGQRDVAIEIFQGMTEDYPELPEPYNNLAVLYAAQGQYDKARDMLERALQAHPKFAIAEENLGDVYAKLAAQAYGKAAQLDKNNTTAPAKLIVIEQLFTGNAPAASTTVVTPAPTR